MGAPHSHNSLVTLEWDWETGGIMYYKILLFYLFYDTLHTYIAILVSHFCYHWRLVS